MNIGMRYFLEVYRLATRIRIVEEKIAEEYQKGEMRCPVHLSVGQELISAVVGINQKKIDTAVSSHRAHAHYLAKGGNLNKMIAEIYGKVTGCSKGRGGSMHLIDLGVGFLGSSAIVGNSIPIGVGAGFSHKLSDSDALSFIFVGDGAIEEGSFYESINFSAVQGLPVVFICENNFYSVYTGLNHRQPAERKIYKMVGAMGVSGIKIDTADMYMCLSQTKEVISEARKIKKPLFIEYETYRWLEHCGPNDDNSLGYRPDGELKFWQERDWMPKIESILLSEDVLTLDQIKSTKESILSEVNLAIKLAKEDAFPTLEESSVGVYAQ